MLAELKRYKKAFKKRQKKLINYIKKSYTEYNGEVAFLCLNHILLENYLEYYSNRDNVYQSDDTLDDIIKQIKECLEIMNRLIEDDYDRSAIEFADKHQIKRVDGDLFYTEWDSEASKQTWLSKVKLAESQKALDFKKVFKLIATYCESWWD